MGIEIEAKFRLTDPATLVARLQARDAKRVALINEINTYLDTADHDLKSADRGLRVRIERGDGQPERVVITHKGPRRSGPLKCRQEDECVVETAESAMATLRALGYRPVLTFEKRRTRYLLDGCRVEVDELPLLGWFVEIEGPTTAAVQAVRADLGLDDASVLRTSYIAMLQAYAAEHRLTDRVVRLDPIDDDLALPAAG